MFSFCQSLTSLNIINFNTQSAERMENLFYHCDELLSIVLSNFNTVKVNNMNYMFKNCGKIKYLDLSSFKTSKVTSFSDMFSFCISLNNKPKISTIIINDRINDENKESEYYRSLCEDLMETSF